MPRAGRIVLPNYPHHVIHRGHNRSLLFSKPTDFKVYLKNLVVLKEEFGCLLYAYCLMTNHVHLILDPGQHADSLGLLMKRTAGRYTAYRNRTCGRTGTAWNGRFRSNPIQTDRYLLTCCRYVELNPVRAGIVPQPGDYPWSSFRDRAGIKRQGWLDEDPAYTAMGTTRRQREVGYREFMLDPKVNPDHEAIRLAIKGGYPLGDAAFLHYTEETLGKRISTLKQGRPKRSDK
jgi:putative transposase